MNGNQPDEESRLDEIIDNWRDEANKLARTRLDIAAAFTTTHLPIY